MLHFIRLEKETMIALLSPISIRCKECDSIKATLPLVQFTRRLDSLRLKLQQKILDPENLNFVLP